MRITVRPVPYILMLSLALSASCSLFKKEDGPSVQVVVGRVSVERDAGSKDVAVGFVLRPQDAVAAARASKLKVVAGTGGVYANEGASFKVAQAVGEEALSLFAEKGEYYFAARQGGVVTCRFGEIVISMREADASLSIDESGRLAVFFVISGTAQVRRVRDERSVAACRAVALDAAGISEDAVVDRVRGEIIARLRGWVGETVIDRATASGNCRPEPAERPAAEPVSPPDTQAAVSTDKEKPPVRTDTVRVTGGRPQPPPARVDTVGAGPRSPSTQISQPARADTAMKQPAPQPPPGTLKIEHIIGPKQVYASGEFVLKATVSGSGAASGYVWRFRIGEETFVHRTTGPQVSATLEKVGEYDVTCEVLGEGGATLASQQVRVQVAPGQLVISAGGPYNAVLNKPVRLLGNAKSRGGKIVRYEWYITSSEKPDVVSQENAVVEHVFTAAGQHRAVFAARLADGTSASDTAIVNVAASALPAPAPAPAVVDTPSAVVCPKDMATVGKGKFCVDKYEWPNKRGAVPLANVSWHEAAQACESVGKRLCAAGEWTGACGNGGRRYPYGDEFDAKKCNILDNPRSKNALSAAGAFGECAGALSVFDMSGNAAEWVASSDPAKAQAFGGFYQSGADESDCGSHVTLDKNRKYFYVGFRCCK